MSEKLTEGERMENPDDTMRRAETGYAGPLDLGIGGPSPEACEWPPGMTFGFHDEPGEHDPCYVIMPGGAMIAFNHHVTPGVDIARARFVQAACNAALLNAARAEARPAVDREAVARIVYAAMWPDNSPLVPWEHIETVMVKAPIMVATDAILALLPPAASPGEAGAAAP